MNQTNTQKLLSAIFTINKTEDIKQIESRIKLVNNCFFQNNSIEKEILTSIKNLFSSKKQPIILETLLELIRHRNPKTSINLDILNNLNSISINNNEFEELFKKSILSIQTANFLNNFKKHVNEIDIYNYKPDKLNAITSKIMEFQNNFEQNDEISINHGALKYLETNKDVKQCKQNTQKTRYLTNEYPTFNKLLNGFKNGELVIYSADSGFGKSTFAINLMLQLTEHSMKNNLKKPKIVMMNYEMEFNDILKRIFAIKNDKDIDLTKITSADYNITLEYPQLNPTKQIEVSHEYESIKKVIKLMQNYDIIIKSPFYNADISYLEQYVRLKKEKNEIDILIIDHLHLMKDINENNFIEKTDSIVWKLKMLALSLDIPIILLAQFNKESSKTTEKNMHSMKGSAGIAQHANVVFTLTKKSIPKEENKNKPEPDNMDVVLTIHKNRQGKTGIINFEFDKPHQRFIENESVC
jgi:replicative DNA helicase